MSSSNGKTKDDNKLPAPHLDKSCEYVTRSNRAPKLEDPYKYKRSYSAEDVNKRFTDQRQDFDQINSPQTAKEHRYRVILLILLSIVLCVLIGFTIYMHLKEFPPDEITRPYRQAADLSRKHVVVMSDNLECSTYIKSLFMQKIDPRDAMFHGMMCLSITEPHTAAPDSAVSTLWFYIQEKEALTEALLADTLKPRLCNKEKLKSRVCSLRAFMYVHGSFGSYQWIKLSDIYSQYLMFGERWFWYYYQRYFKKFYGAGDFRGSYRQVQGTYGYRDIDPVIPSFLRRFRVSRLFETALKQVRQSNFFQQAWVDFLGYRDMISVKVNNIISIKRAVAQYYMGLFFINNVQRQSWMWAFNTPEPLAFDSTISNFSTSIASTDEFFSMSNVTELVVDLVYEARRKQPLNETAFYAAVLRAQRLAYYLGIEMEEFKPISNRQYWDELENRVSYVTGSSDQKFHKSINCTMLQKQPSRVATLMYWVEKDYSFLNIVNMALPNLFGSRVSRNGSEISPYQKFECGPHKSIEIFTSSASLVITKNSQNRQFVQGSSRAARMYNVKPWIAVSASGSVRTVETVAITALRILLFKESPAQAVNAPGAYYDVRDGKFYCDKRRSEETTEMFSKMEKEFNLECHSVPEKDFMANDRVAMAAQMGQNEYIRSAVDGRALDFNYPVGY